MSLIRTCHDFEQYVAESREKGIPIDSKGFVAWSEEQLRMEGKQSNEK